MPNGVEEYRSAVMAAVCPKCVDGDGSGGCRRGAWCALTELFPAVLAGVRTVSSASMIPYEDMLRTRICVDCSSQSETGKCSVRDDIGCALNRYFPLVVSTIEEKDLDKRFAQISGG